jgi:hypothetical protein
VLAEILGSKYMIPQDVPIHHIYEYFDFRNKIWEDNSVFEVFFMHLNSAILHRLD